MKGDGIVSEPTKRTKPETGEMIFSGWWDDGANQVLAGWTRSNSSFVRNAFDIAKQVLTYSEARLQANVDHWAGLASCRTPNDVIKIQQSFAQTAAAEFANEATKLATRMVDTFSGAAESFNGRAAKS